MKGENSQSHAYELEIHKIDEYELKTHKSHAYELTDALKVRIHKSHAYDLEIHKIDVYEKKIHKVKRTSRWMHESRRFTKVKRTS